MLFICTLNIIYGNSEITHYTLHGHLLTVTSQLHYIKLFTRFLDNFEFCSLLSRKHTQTSIINSSTYHIRPGEPLKVILYDNKEFPQMFTLYTYKQL